MLIFLAMDSSTLFVTDAKVLAHCFIHRIRIRFGITVLFNHLSYYLLSAPLEWRNRTEVHLLRLRAQLLHPRRPRLCIRALHRLLNVKKSKVIIIIILIDQEEENIISLNIFAWETNGRNLNYYVQINLIKPDNWHYLSVNLQSMPLLMGKMDKR